MHTNRVGLALAALLAVFAFGAVAAAPAEAEEAPFWTVPKAEGSKETKRLAAGETRYVTIKSYKTFSASSGGITGTCPAIKLKEGVLLGSNAGEPGTAEGVLEIEGGCTQTGNGTGCKVVEPIVSKPAKAELVEDVEANKEHKALGVEFFPVKGAAFLTLKFTGTCTINEITVEGSVVAEVYTDPNNGSLGELVKLPNTGKQGTSWLGNFPGKPIEKVWLIKGGSGAEASVGLTANTESATLAGTALASLANSKRESVEEEWSPLP